MPEFNKFEHQIPWPTLKEHLEQLKEQWLVTALEGPSEDRDKGAGRILMLMDLLNLPITLDILEEEGEKDAEEESETNSS